MADHAMLRESLATVRRGMAAAATRAGRNPDEVTLVAVSKTHPAEAIRLAYDVGQRVFGENYGQELRDKTVALADLPDLAWHFIGPLQRNKVKYVVGHAAMIHSVDSVRLLEELERRAAGLETEVACLIEVNVADEASKSGVAPDEADELLEAFEAHAHLACVGLMTMPPFTDEAEESRPYFRALRELRDRLAASSQHPLPHLSMGMTQDYEVAIEEGATIVRVGTAIFGGRG